MPGEKISRRKALQIGLPAAGIVYTAGLPQLLSCKAKNKTTDKSTADNKTQRRPKKTPVQRGNPYAGKDEMYLHTKSKTLHYPFVFKTYGKIKDEHVTVVNSTDWENQLNNGAHFTRDGSGLIFERLALKNMGDMNNENLSRSSSVLSRTFKTDYIKLNRYNWRGYHLLAQLIALNSAIPDTEKWGSFSDMIREANVSQIKKMPKRHGWIASEQLFNERVKYIHDHADVYTARLKKRMA